MNLKNITADKLVALYANRDLTVTEVITSVFEEIDRTDKSVRAFITLCRDRALEEARRADAQIEAGEALGAFTGVPLAVKDNMTVRDVPTTCGSKMLAHYIPPYTATAVDRLRGAGAIIVGKTNMDEYAMGSSTENSGFFVTHNPHDLDRVPGGSSGGSAASVASGMSLIALGSDTGGSIRQPASFCGVVGMKPTYGRVSRYGLVAYASSLDQIGPFSKSVRECAQVLETIAGFDNFDSTSADTPVTPYSKSLDKPMAGVRIGIPREYFPSGNNGMDSEVRANVENAIKQYEAMGCKIEEIRLPHTEHAVATYYLIATAGSEFEPGALRRSPIWSAGNRNRRAPGDVPQHADGRIREGSEAPDSIGNLCAERRLLRRLLLKAMKVRTLICQDFRKRLKRSILF
jgi:aspartyl-tRNA(Asn)/glutamyl-tRNA(Gln) amidotransferase subunit A